MVFIISQNGRNIINANNLDGFGIDVVTTSGANSLLAYTVERNWVVGSYSKIEYAQVAVQTLIMAITGESRMVKAMSDEMARTRYYANGCHTEID